MGIRIKTKFKICLLCCCCPHGPVQKVTEGDVQILLHVLTEWMKDVDSQWKARDCGKHLPSHWCLVNCKNRSSSSSRRLNAKLISVSATTTYVYNVASCKLTKRTLNWKLRTDGRETNYDIGQDLSTLWTDSIWRPTQAASQPASRADIKAHRT